jgi:hypothetical protein
MNEYRQRELDRDQWRDLVRGLCLVQSAGYPGSVSISKGFLRSPVAEVEHMARVAVHIAREYELLFDIRVTGNTIILRLGRAGEIAYPLRETLVAPPKPDDAASVATNAPVQRAPLRRLLHLVHPQSKAQL